MPLPGLLGPIQDGQKGLFHHRPELPTLSGRQLFQAVPQIAGYGQHHHVAVQAYQVQTVTR
jgi:hypothetical protein